MAYCCSSGKSDKSVTVLRQESAPRSSRPQPTCAGSPCPAHWHRCILVTAGLSLCSLLCRFLSGACGAMCVCWRHHERLEPRPASHPLQPHFQQSQNGPIIRMGQSTPRCLLHFRDRESWQLKQILLFFILFFSVLLSLQGHFKIVFAYIT